MSSQEEKKPSLEEEAHVLYLYETEKKIYQRRFVGFFRKLKKRSGIPLLLGYLLLPWLQIDGRQAVWFDLPVTENSVNAAIISSQASIMKSWGQKVIHKI